MMLQSLLSALVFVKVAQALNQPHVNTALTTKTLIRRDGQKHLQIDQHGALEQKHLAIDQHATHAGNTRANLVPVLIRNNAECQSSDTSMGDQATKEECAAAVEAAGGTFMIFGIGDKAGACYQEHPTSSGCPEGWETDQYDFYELQAPPAITVVNTDEGGQDLGGITEAFKFDLHQTAIRPRDPCADLGCPESEDNCTYLTGATISMVKNNGTCAEAETMVSLGDKDGNNGMVLDLVGCIAVVQQAVLDPVPTCQDRFTQDSITKECKCLAPSAAACTPTEDPAGTHCLWWMVYK